MADLLPYAIPEDHGNSTPRRYARRRTVPAKLRKSKLPESVAANKRTAGRIAKFAGKPSTFSASKLN